MAKDGLQNLFPISEFEWRRIVGKMRGEARRAREVYESRYQDTDIPDAQVDIWLAGVAEGKMEAYEYIEDFCYWWEHERQ